MMPLSAAAAVAFECHYHATTTVDAAAWA